MANDMKFDTAVATVEGKLDCKTKHLHLKTKQIINASDLDTALDKIQKKNFMLTSNNHLAAIFIKIVEIYVAKKIKEEKRADTFIKYINLLKKRNLDPFTVKKILTGLELGKLYTLINKQYDSISDEAHKILKNVKFTDIDLDQRTEETFAETAKQISDAKGGLLTSSQFDELSKVFEKIKDVCKNDFRSKELLTPGLQHCLPVEFRIEPETIKKDTLTTLHTNLYNEFAFLYYVIHQKDKEANKLLPNCHRDAVRKLLTANKRIVEAYAKIDKANAEAKTPVHKSSNSDTRNSSKIRQTTIPDKPEYPPPALPTSDVSDQPPPLRPVNTNDIQKSSNPRKTRRKTRGEPQKQKLTPPPTLTTPPVKQINLNSGKAKPKPKHKPRNAP